jgi:hypothetical protein
LDGRSFRRDTVNEILGRETAFDYRDIEAFTRAFINRYPHKDTVESVDDDVYTLHVPSRFRNECEDYYGIRLRWKYTGTFNPQKAIEDDTIEFFAFGHPLFDAIIRYCTDDPHNNHFNPRVAYRVLESPDYSGYEGLQFNYIVNLDGVRPYRKLIPVVLDRNGVYDQELSHTVLSLTSRNQDKPSNPPHITPSAIEKLEHKSQNIIHEIANRELKNAEERNAQDYADRQEKANRLFRYRRYKLESELKKRKKRVKDARSKGQTQILPALKGQVRAAEQRIAELKDEHERELENLEQGQEVQQSVELLNIAYVKIE